MFLWIERMIEGDRTKQMKLDQAPLDARKVSRQGHQARAVARIRGVHRIHFRRLLHADSGAGREIVRASRSGRWETFWMLFYGFATYGNAGWMREQVCIYMCPYARFQSAMFDRDTLIISYDEQRGEPRGSRKRGIDTEAQGLGDCVDCTLCVQVCPTGIDIRKGLQYQCIGCAACVDACDEVMERWATPRADSLYHRKRDGRRRGHVYGHALLSMPTARSAHRRPGLLHQSTRTDETGHHS